MKGGLIKWASENHVAANFAMFAVLMAGFATWFQLRKEIFPETALDAVQISVAYPNATPEDVQDGVTIPIEEGIADVEGIERLTSSSSENLAVINAEIANGYDVRTVMDDIKTRVDAVDNIAANAERPVLEELVLNPQVLSIAVMAETDEKNLRLLGEKLRDELLAYRAEGEQSFGQKMAAALRGEPKITRVSLSGTRPYEIGIEVPEATLESLGLTLDDVALAVRKSALDVPGGAIKTEGGELVVRAIGRRYEGKQFTTIPVVTGADGSTITLGEIAEIEDGFEDVEIVSSFDGNPAVFVDVYRVGEEDTIVLADLVRGFIESKKDSLPEGVELQVWNDQSVYLRGRLDLLARNASTGLALVFLVLALFLRPSLAFLVALGIPVCFAGGIWLMPILGVSINMISLFAFILVLGIVVDDAIVVGENVYQRISSGEDPKVAAWKGTHEVGVIVIFGVLTTMIAFTPMLGLSGVSGKIWPNIPLIVIPVLAFSLVQSKLVLPAHLALLKPSGERQSQWFLPRMQRRIAGGLENFVEKVYQPTIDKLLRIRYVVAAAFLALLLLIGGLVGGKWIRSEFFPDVEADLLNTKLEMPRGISFEKTAEAVEQIEAAVIELNRRYREETGREVIKHVRATAGSQPLQLGFTPGNTSPVAHLGEVTVELYPSEDRQVSAEVLKEEWRKLTGPITGAVEVSFRTQSASGGNAIDIEFNGPDLTMLRRAVGAMQEDLADYEGVIEISDTDREGKKELRFRKLTAEGEALGLRLDDVARQVRQAFFGAEVDRLQRGRDEVKVMVRYPRDEREELATIEDMKIRTSGGAEVPLMQLVEPEYGRGPDTIRRVNRQRAIQLIADIDPTSGANANEVITRFEKESLSIVGKEFPGVEWAFQGEQRDQRDSVREMSVKFAIALVLMFVMMAIALKSYIQPVIVMSVIPFGIVGAVIGHMIMGTNLSIMSMCGIVALAGVVVNDSLVMVDYVNRYRAKGASLIDAARQAGARRFRAILLTSLTTFAGLLPMLFETDIQARFLIPMAISLGFGILFATAITLILLPCVYLILEDIKALFARYRAWGREPEFEDFSRSDL